MVCKMVPGDNTPAVSNDSVSYIRNYKIESYGIFFIDSGPK